MIISADTEKASDITQHLYTINTLNPIGRDWNFLNRIKATYEKPTAHMTLSGERLKAFPRG